MCSSAYGGHHFKLEFTHDNLFILFVQNAKKSFVTCEEKGCVEMAWGEYEWAYYWVYMSYQPPKELAARPFCSSECIGCGQKATESLVDVSDPDEAEGVGPAGCVIGREIFTSSLCHKCDLCHSCSSKYTLSSVGS